MVNVPYMDPMGIDPIEKIPEVVLEKSTSNTQQLKNLNPSVPDKAKTVPCWPRSLVDWGQTR